MLTRDSQQTPEISQIIRDYFGDSQYITRDALEIVIHQEMLYELKDTGSCDSPEIEAFIKKITNAVKKHNKHFERPKSEKKKRRPKTKYRKGLKKFNGQRMGFTAKIERFGTKRGWKGREEETILLTDVRLKETGEKLTDHLWFTKGKSWNGAVSGCTVEFDARVTSYEKGYRGYRDDVYDAPISIDYKLERPTKVEIYA